MAKTIKIMSSEKKLHFETLQLHVGQEQADPTTDARAVPIYQTTSYVFHNSQHASDRFHLKDAGNIYGRLTNSTQAYWRTVWPPSRRCGRPGCRLRSRCRDLRHYQCGLAGDHVVATKTIYGGTIYLLAHTLTKYGIESTFVDPDNYEELEAATAPIPSWCSSRPWQPQLNISDIERTAEIAHRHGYPHHRQHLGTPFLIRPIEHGADNRGTLCHQVYRRTRQLTGGVIVDGGTFDWQQNDKFPASRSPMHHTTD
jgi:O-acetylhomoserine (thiol)-lyase